MALHRLSSFTYEVPNPDEVVSYYREFGLTHEGGGVMSSVDGGKQLFITKGAYRRIAGIEIGADDADDLDRISASLAAMDIEATLDGDTLTTADPVTRTGVTVTVQGRVVQPEIKRPAENGPGRIERVNARADGLLREDPVKPRRLGHVFITSPDSHATITFFTEGVGFKISDYADNEGNAFMRCSTDHHNLGVFDGPVTMPHHTSWQVDDVDEIGRAAEDLMAADEGRNMWGFGRHFVGSNYFWYLKDPAGTFSEYYADMDEITDDDLWTPEIALGLRGEYRWGPKPPEAFLTPPDIAELIAAQAN